MVQILYPEARQCPLCWTEYQIDIQSLQKDGIAVFITKWQNIGSGTHDPQWKALFGYRVEDGSV